MNYKIDKINTISAPTWSWLNVNAASVKFDAEILDEYDFSVGHIPDGFTIQTFSPASRSSSGEGAPQSPYFQKRDIPTTEQDLEELVQSGQNRGFVIRIRKGYEAKEPLILTLHAANAIQAVIENTHIIAEENSRASIIIKHSSEADVAAIYAGICDVQVKSGAQIQLILIQDMGMNILQQTSTAVNIDETLTANKTFALQQTAGNTEKPHASCTFQAKGTYAFHTRARISKNARLDLFFVELGAARFFSGCEVLLQDSGAHAEVKSIYIGDSDRHLDMNYRIRFQAPATIGNTTSRGVLMDKCQKIFRAELDFQSGAYASKGREEESVITMSDHVKNVSAPFLLCGEDDVEGEHAASTGKLDENMIFYLMTRGIPETEARRILIEAAFTEMLQNIPDETIRHAILQNIGERIEN